MGIFLVSGPAGTDRLALLAVDAGLPADLSVLFVVFMVGPFWGTVAVGNQGGYRLDCRVGIVEIRSVDSIGARPVHSVAGQSAGRPGLDAGGQPSRPVGRRMGVPAATAAVAVDVWHGHDLVFGE